MATGTDTRDGLRAEGTRALARGEWEVARRAFEAVLVEEPSAEVHELHSWACWWMSDGAAVIRARENAFRAYARRGDRYGAGRMAAWLSGDVRDFRDEDAVGQGWLRRAERLLDGLPESADHGWLAQLQANYLLNVDGDLAGTAERARAAARIGREHHVADLEAVGLAQEGISLVLRGDIPAGMRCLDEASVIAGDERHELAISPGWAVCCMLSACDGVGDFPRAAQFCEVMRRFSERWNGRHFMGLCRTSYGQVLATHGDWAAADVELTAAVDDMLAVRPTMAGQAQARLARLRARQGRMPEARELYGRAGADGLLGLGELALDAGAPEEAIEAADRVLRRLPDDVLLGRVPALELQARARGARGEPELAAEACDELGAICRRLGTPYLCALAAPGRIEGSRREARAAQEVFARLGAERDVERARALLVAPSTPAVASEELSARELEVLRLVAQGLNDAQVAERLFLSPHTVHRHMANIRTKLRLPSRAAAVAHASRADLL